MGIELMLPLVLFAGAVLLGYQAARFASRRRRRLGKRTRPVLPRRAGYRHIEAMEIELGIIEAPVRTAKPITFIPETGKLTNGGAEEIRANLLEQIPKPYAQQAADHNAAMLECYGQSLEAVWKQQLDDIRNGRV